MRILPLGRSRWPEFWLTRFASIAEIIKQVKRGSSLRIKGRDSALEPFAWQSGYCAFSIGFSQVEAERLSIRKQVEHHRRFSFQDEFRRMLARNPGLSD